MKLKSIIRKHWRDPEALMAAFTILTGRGELLHWLTELICAGELRLHPRKRQRGRSLLLRFRDYDAANKWVADWFLQAARAKRDEGRTHYSIGNLLEKLRHDVAKGIVKTDAFRISNDYQSCYVRQVLMRDPSLCGLFELQRRTNADALVVDCIRWTTFAEVHKSELWPEQETAEQKKNAGQSELPLDAKTA